MGTSEVKGYRRTYMEILAKVRRIIPAAGERAVVVHVHQAAVDDERVERLQREEGGGESGEEGGGEREVSER